MYVALRSILSYLADRILNFFLSSCHRYITLSSVRIFQAEGAQLLSELPLSNVIELSFSPRGTYLSTWERPIKLDDNQQHKNLRVFSVSTGEELVAFTQKSQEGWDLQYTITESHAIRLVAQEIQVFRPTEWGKGVVDKLKVEGATKACLSPGLNPSVAVFVAEKKVSNTKPILILINLLTMCSFRALQPASKSTVSSPSPHPQPAKKPSSKPIDPQLNGTSSAPRSYSSPKPMSTTPTSRTTGRLACTCSAPQGTLTVV